MTFPSSRVRLLLIALLPATALSQNPAAAPTLPSQDPATASPGANFNNQFPGLDPSGGLLRFNGQTWAVENNLLFKARFEKFLATPEEMSAQEAAHRQILNEIIALLDPNVLKPQTVTEAYRLLARASGFAGDSRLCDTLSNAIYSVWQSKRNQGQLAQANVILEEERARTRRNMATSASADSGGLRNAPQSGSAIIQAGRLESLTEGAARIQANNVKSDLSELQAKIQFQGLLLQFFIQRRFHHVIIGTRFYRVLFNDGDSKLNLPDATQNPFKASGMPPTVSTIDSLANEAMHDTQTNVQAFHKLYEIGELRSASERLRDGLIIGEFMPEIRTVPFERKRKVLSFLQKSEQLKSALEVRDYGTALQTLEGPDGLQKIAPDFDSSKYRSLIETTRSTARLMLSKARNAAISGDRAGFEKALNDAASIWPNNPELAEVASKAFQAGDVGAQALQEMEQLIAQKNTRRIAEDPGRFLAAVQSASPEKQAQLKSILDEFKTIEGTLTAAREMDRQGNPAGAWEAVEQAGKRFPGDLNLSQAHALYTTKAADFVRIVRRAQDHETRAQAPTSLAWFLAAQRLYPKSELAADAIKRLQVEVLTSVKP
jgi:hypothetical protein